MKHFLNQQVHWIDTNAALELQCEQWRSAKILSVDTEFMRSRTYFPIAGLFQVNDAKANYLIDPTTIDDFSPLAEILVNPASVKILHSCSEDLEVFHRALGVLPENIFDTQIAAAMLGYGFSMGFANLCSTLFKIDLPKSETRSNWLQRPLSEAQIHYAALDVEYLTAMAIRLIKEAQALKRLDWIKEECEQLKNSFYSLQDVDQAWQRNKSAWKLKPRELQRFIFLSRWRENCARDRDVPRNRVVKDHSLLELAQNPAETIEDLKKFEGFSERRVRSDGETVLNLLQEANRVEETDLPKRLERPLSSSARDKLKKLRSGIQNRAEELNIACEVLVKKKDLEELLRQDAQNADLPQGIKGWREPLVGEFILTEFKKTVGA